MAGLHHQCNGHKLGQTFGDGDGETGLACCSLCSKRVGHDWATEQQQNLMYVLNIITIQGKAVQIF